MSLGKRLRKARDNKGWTQIYAARLIGVTNQVLSNYERDYRDPDTDTLNRMALLYGVSTDMLLGNENRNDPTPPNNRAHQNPSSEVSAEEMEHIMKRRRLNQKDRQTLDIVAERLGGEEEQAASKA